MAGGPKITEQIQQLIVDTYLEHPDWVAKQVQKVVDDEVRRKGLAVRGPGLSAVQKKLAAYRSSFSKQTSLKTFRTPWSLGSLCQDDMSPEAIQIMLLVQKFRRLRDEGPLTIPEAKWVARLSRFFHPIFKTDELQSGVGVNEDKLQDLSIWAQWYADRELASRVANIPLDTSDFDLAMAAGRMEVLGKYIGTTNMISEAEKIRIGQEVAREIELKIFGKSLDGYDLSGTAWCAYIYGIYCMAQSDQWENIDEDRQKSLIMDLRDWVIKNQQNPNLFEDIDIKWRNEIEGVQQ
jgi:hypothetical protein